jgi:hypothetical protein
MAEKLTSIFGAYSGKMQVMIDKAKDKFAPVWWTNYFDWGVPKTTLTFETAIGRSRIEAAASVVDRNSPAPLRSRKGIEKLHGEVPAIKEKFKMTEADYRDWEMLKAMNVDNGTQLNAMLDLMFNDIKVVADSTMKRLDYMVLQGISTGEINIDIANNPDGVVSGSIPLLMPDDNKRKVATVWSSPSSATPFTDIQNVVTAAEDKGIGFEKILMTRSTFMKMQKCDEVIKLLNAFYRLPSNAKTLATIDQINEVLESYMFPKIEIVNQVIGVEKKGVISPVRPFKDESVVFIPAGKLGVMHNAVAIEELHPVEGVSYAKNGRTLISKWAQNDPFGEYTQGELNAFPGFEAIDQIFILDSATAQS